VVGPTALDQESRTDRSIHPSVALELDATAKRIVPDLNPSDDCIGEYVGVRPGTDQRDYQIHSFPKEQMVAVAGIRSTGLTASLGIGNYVKRQLEPILGKPQKKRAIQTTPMPPLSRLVDDYHKHDGHVFIQGYRYKVTHPLTRIGWRSRTGLASKRSSKL